MKVFVKDAREDREQQVVIVSASRADQPESINEHDTYRLKSLLDNAGVFYKEATGCYKGARNVSFVCYPKNRWQLNRLNKLAFVHFEQESILVRDLGFVWLEYANGDCQSIGKELVSVSKEIALAQDAYTVVGGKFWIVK